VKRKALAAIAALLLTIPSYANAATVESLIENYGKEAIMKAIAHRIHNKFTVSVDGTTMQKYAPSTDYISAWTLAVDIESAGLTANAVEKILLDEIEKTKREEKIKLDAKQLKNEIDIERQKKAEALHNEELKFFSTASPEVREQFKKALANGAAKESTPAMPTNEKSRMTASPVEQSTNPICNIDHKKLSSDLKTELTNKYPAAYSLQKTLYDGNMNSYDILCNLHVTNIDIEILNKHLQKYYPSISLIKTLYEADIKAYQALRQ
jgi:hypothetical protein